MIRLITVGYLTFVVAILLLAQNLASNMTILPGASDTHEVRLRESLANGTNYVAIKSPTNITSTYSLIAPTAWTDNSVLQTTTGGQLVFATVDSNQIDNGAVTSAKFASKAVGPNQIAAGAVGNTQITDQSITIPKLDSTYNSFNWSFNIYNGYYTLNAGWGFPIMQKILANNIVILSGSCWTSAGSATVDIYNNYKSAQLWAGHLTCDNNEHNVDTGTGEVQVGSTLAFALATASALHDLHVAVRYKYE